MSLHMQVSRIMKALNRSSIASSGESKIIGIPPRNFSLDTKRLKVIHGGELLGHVIYTVPPRFLVEYSSTMTIHLVRLFI